MLKLKISNQSDGIYYFSTSGIEGREDFIPTEINTPMVKYFKRVECKTRKHSLEMRVMIYFDYDFQYISYDDCYSYIKNSIKDFVEYTNKNGELYLVNSKLCIATEEHDFGIIKRFSNGDAVHIETK